jgi:hypothetical protein
MEEDQEVFDDFLVDDFEVRDILLTLCYPLSVALGVFQPLDSSGHSTHPAARPSMPKGGEGGVRDP